MLNYLARTIQSGQPRGKRGHSMTDGIEKKRFIKGAL